MGRSYNGRHSLMTVKPNLRLVNVTHVRSSSQAGHTPRMSGPSRVSDCTTSGGGGNRSTRGCMMLMRYYISTTSYSAVACMSIYHRHGTLWVRWIDKVSVEGFSSSGVRQARRRASARVRSDLTVFSPALLLSLTYLQASYMYLG